MRKFLLATLLLPSVFFFSCQKNVDAPANEPTPEDGIVAQLQRLSVTVNNTGTEARNSTPRQASFKLLSFAIAKAELANELNDPNFAYTLFAPTDEAFAAAGFGTKASIEALPIATLQNILLYHVYASKVLAAQVPTTYTELTMLNTQKAYIIRRGSNVFINGVQVVAADIAAKSGVIHAVDRILFPPAGNLVNAVVAEELTYLAAAVTRAGLGTTLSTGGPFTLFAPTNQAFINAGYPTIASIMAEQPSALVPLLTYHVAAGRTFSADLSNGQVLTMLSTGTTTISLTGGATIDGTGSAPSNIIKTNIMATNGVIHVIDRVLKP